MPKENVKQPSHVAEFTGSFAGAHTYYAFICYIVKNTSACEKHHTACYREFENEYTFCNIA